MLITINNSDSKYFSDYRLWVAKDIIFNYPMNATEKALDKYLWDSNKILLKDACLKIVENIMITGGSDITLTIQNKNLEKLYRIITYGTGKVKGSKILLNALR